MAPGVRSVYQTRLEPEFRTRHGRAPANRRDVKSVLGSNPYYRRWSALERREALAGSSPSHHAGRPRNLRRRQGFQLGPGGCSCSSYSNRNLEQLRFSGIIARAPISPQSIARLK